MVPVGLDDFLSFDDDRSVIGLRVHFHHLILNRILDSAAVLPG